MYQYGKGVTQDLKLAVFWFQQVANQGNVQAQYNLGELYYAGDEFGGVADESRATVQWTQLLKSADKASQLFKLAQAGLSCIDRGVPSKSCAPLRCSIEGRSDCPDL
jgi:TPR repeat protein